MDRRAIYPKLLNAYLERLSLKGEGDEPDGPFWGAQIEALVHEHGLVLNCQHFAFEFPLTALGMLEARRVIDELVKLAEGNALGLGDALELDPERGYVHRAPHAEEEG